MAAATLDANSLASAALTEITPPGQILDACFEGWFDLILSEHIISELRRALGNRYFTARRTPEQISDFIRRVTSRATIVPLTVTVQGVASHPEDDLVLATAVSGHADFLVTGDRQLLRLGTYEGVVIVTPRDFLAMLGGL
jgi:putative PIN family toxin of toxin-antitoxin system